VHCRHDGPGGEIHNQDYTLSTLPQGRRHTGTGKLSKALPAQLKRHQPLAGVEFDVAIGENQIYRFLPNAALLDTGFSVPRHPEIVGARLFQLHLSASVSR